MASVPFKTHEGFLPVDEIEQFHREGYLIKRGALDEGSVEKLRTIGQKILQEVDKEVSSERYPFQPDQQITHIRGTQIVFKKAAAGHVSILRVVGCGGMQEQVLEVLRSDQIANTFFSLLGCEGIEHIICQLHPKQPHDGVEFPKHRDKIFRKAFDPEWTDVLGNGSYAICIVPIDPMSPENGGLYVDKNSYPEKDDWIADEEALKMEPSDLLFMHPDILHWSGPNTSDRPRMTFLTGFAAEGANHRTYPGAQINKLVRRTGESICIEPILREGTDDFSQIAGKH